MRSSCRMSSSRRAIPGTSMLKCLVPGVQKLVDLGIADPKTLGLHGHSWGGYGTAYVVTQTNMFKAAVAGRAGRQHDERVRRHPLGVRGRPPVPVRADPEPHRRQPVGIPGAVHRELGPVLCGPHQTPLLSNTATRTAPCRGTSHRAVPRAAAARARTASSCNTAGEPHHLRKYPNKLDYSIKMKEYFDHYLKGEPAAAWIREGVTYKGK